MADSGALHGDEAVAPSIVLTTELNARAVGADASDAFTIETGLALWTNDWSVDATQAAIATVVGAGIAVVAAYRCPRANTTGAYVGAGTGVAIVTGSALVGWTGIARSISRIAETHVARVILFRAVDSDCPRMRRRHRRCPLRCTDRRHRRQRPVCGTATQVPASQAPTLHWSVSAPHSESRQQSL